MQEDIDLRDFEGITRIFPLKNMVMFPHVVLPLHIFEPRYRQMTEQALKSDRLITIVQTVLTSSSSALAKPPVEKVGCLGRIIRHEQLPDGCFNFLLVGKVRVKIIRELDVSTLYRQCEVQVLNDQDDTQGSTELRESLVSSFQELHENWRGTDLADVLGHEMTLGSLSDILAHVLCTTPCNKQRLLDQPNVPARCLELLKIMKAEIRTKFGKDQKGLPFPPPFSLN